MASRAVYPRWRGELPRRLAQQSRPRGLSPLARGTLFFQEFIFLIERFIPAGAGNSCCSGAPLTDSPVYPRWRGELINPPCAGFFVPGLSPLARGTRKKAGRILVDERFIPAGAGNSKLFFPIPALHSVYPRWRGELSKHNLLLINYFLSQSQSTNFTVSHKQHIHYVKERLIH